MVTASDITKGKLLFSDTDSLVYYLDIAPQQIVIKDNFATNISATRRGIIVESEGIVFKDITIKGTTGVFPGDRGAFSGPQANLADITKAPREPAGVSDAGLSKKSNVKIVSGYQEFQMLHQFFLKFAHDKVKSNGDLFMIFLNEKDNQALIVEPLDFTMDRNSKRPLEYFYTIQLKAIGNFNTLFTTPSGESATDIFQQIGNISANLSAGIGQVRAAINATSTLLQKTFQAIDQTINGPLHQIQFALQDLSEGVATTLSLPAILARNFTTDIAAIRDQTSNILNGGSTTVGGNLSTPGSRKSTTTANAAAATATVNNTAVAAASSSTPVKSSETAATTASSFVNQTRVEDHLANDSRVAMPREFVVNTREKMMSLTEDLADSFNMSDPLYNQIKGRTITNTPGPLKVVSDEEFLLLGNMQLATDSLNQVLATNDAFQTEIEENYQEVKQAFGSSLVDIQAPETVRQVRILRNDTLERLAQRELGSALRWPELVILNKLKPPYLDDNGGDGVKKYGEVLLVPGS